MSENDVCAGGSDRSFAPLRKILKSSRPKGKDWCPGCKKYLAFEQLEVVKRPEFGVKNIVKGCPECHYSMINHTEWTDIATTDSDREGPQ